MSVGHASMMRDTKGTYSPKTYMIYLIPTCLTKSTARK